MKKLIFMLLLFAAVGSQAQFTEIKFPGDNYLLHNFDLSSPSGDTSFVFKIQNIPEHSWSMDFGWTGVAGSGLISLEVTNYDELINWTPYVDNLSTIITGATGSGAWEDDIWSWKYFRIVIEKGTLSSGLLKFKLNTN
jgi:hypothetical protein